MQRPVERIDSPANPRIKAAVALRDRRERDRTGLTIVDGGREALRAMAGGAIIETAFACRSRIGSSEARRVVEKLEQDFGPFGAPIELVDVSERAFERLAFGDRVEGIVLVVRPVPIALAGLELGLDSPLVVVTEDVEKPGNLGAILRSADGAGADAVIAIGGTDLYNPNVIRSSVGTIFGLPVVAATAAEARAWLGERGIRIVAARLDAERLHSAADLTGPLALVLGSEAAGLSPAWQSPDVESVRLPMLGIADSLNVAAAGAVLLYEARRQRDVAEQGLA